MAGFFQQFLKGAGDGFIGSPYLRDYRHASKTFIDDAYANAPKYKWLFHVYFDINKQAVAGFNEAEVFPSTTNYGLLVKTIDLPKYQFDLVELNQYNRKRYIQTKIKYDPIRISFHDDNASQIRHLWFTYFSYYYNDPNQPQPPRDGRLAQQLTPTDMSGQLNVKNIYSSKTDINDQNWGYIGEVGGSASNVSGAGSTFRKAPFFSSIRIYGFNQHNFALYQVINPIIETFSHDNYSYSDNGVMENQMSIRYESVKYYNGALNGQSPSSIVDGFGEPRNYDTTLSPINRPGTNRTILGQGGLLDAINGFTSDVADQNYIGALQTALRTGRTFRNGRQILNAAKSELTSEVIGAIEKAPRNPFNFPSKGSGTGTGQQKFDSRNATSTTPPSVPPLP